VAFRRLPPGELTVGFPEEGSVTKALADRVGAAWPGAIVDRTQGLGWKVTIPLTSSKNIVVRIMDEGSQTKNFRIAVSGQGARTLAGAIAEQSETHFPITEASFDQIMYVIDLILQGK
jgi:hypothetical protein